MIQEAYIRDWRRRAPWSDWLQVEQDLIICRSLVEIFRHPDLSRYLVFRGGTALHKLYFNPPRRYSEDLDLVQIESGPIGPIFDALHDALTPFLGKPKRSQGPGVVTLTYRMSSEVAPVRPMKLKVEINAREHFSVLEVQKKKFEMESPWYSGQAFIPTFALEELLATKLRALYQRRKGRDLFDLWLGLTEGKASPRKIVDIFQHYMAHAGQSVLRATFMENLALKRTHPGFSADMDALLPLNTTYNFQAGFNLIEKELLACM